jgi:hypothetical protein
MCSISAGIITLPPKCEAYRRGVFSHCWLLSWITVSEGSVLINAQVIDSNLRGKPKNIAPSEPYRF